MSPRGRSGGSARRERAATVAVAVAGLCVAVAAPTEAAEVRATRRVEVLTEGELRSAWADPEKRRIDLGADIVLRDCRTGDPIRESPHRLVLDGHGHSISQACFEKRLLRQDGTGFLDLRDVTLTRGGSDGPGAAVTSRGEIMLRDVTITQNLAEEPGGGVFSMRRITVHRSRLNGNLANDDGGALYARRGGVRVYDSIISNNLVDGSGGAVGSTGDILIVRSEVDGNTTDGDGGALYTDEDGDVTVVDSHIDGSDADGPGGAIFTLDGDVAVLGSTLIGNRADDRGGAISGEADVLVVNSTIARNLAVAHAGGGVWSRGDLTLINSTVTNNYAEGEGGGLLSAGRTTLVGTTITSNIAPVGGDLGSAGPLRSFGSIIGPPVTEGVTGDTIPTRRSCRVYAASSDGFNFVNDDTCRLTAETDVTGEDPGLTPLEDDPRGFVLEPDPDSPVRRVIPSGQCVGRLPDPLPGGQLLRDWVDWDQVLAHDAVGRVRDGGDGCDVGAVESLPQHMPAAPAEPDARSRPAPADRRPPVHDPLPAGRGALTGLARALAGGAETLRPSSRRSGHGDPLVAARHRLDRLETRLAALHTEVGRFAQLRRCITEVPVRRVGDARSRWGFTYDERDGTGPGPRPALVPAPRRADFRLLDLATRRPCLSRAADPNGTGDDARSVTTPRRQRPPSLRHLLERLDRLEAEARAVERRADRFDRWESCLGWQPVTSYGEPDQGLGYAVTPTDGRPRFGAALDLDQSEWDDPDYELLSFAGRERPEGTGDCGEDPGEGVDRSPVPGPGRAGDPDDLDDLRQGVAALREDVQDLVEPVAEVTQLDECMFTVGTRVGHGYEYRSRRGVTTSRDLLAYDLRGRQPAEHHFIAFPGEEPPQIECNEDAAGAGTEE